MGVCLGDGGETPALTPQNEAIVKVKTQNALPRAREGVRNFGKKLQQAELLRRNHFVMLNRRNLLETRQMAKAGSLRLTGAAAGNGHNGSSGGGQGEKNTGHGMRWEIFLGNSETRKSDRLIWTEPHIREPTEPVPACCGSRRWRPTCQPRRRPTRRFSRVSWW